MTLQPHALPMAADPKLDGQFQSYETFPDLPNQPKALRLLRTMASIVEPYMMRLKIRIPTLGELRSDGPNRGVNEGPGKLDERDLHITTAIRLRLREHDNFEKFLPLDNLLGIWCHELSHIWCHRHDRYFISVWKMAMDEVELYLGNKIRIRRDSPGGLEKYARQLRLEQFRGKDIVIRSNIQPCEKSIAAAWD